MTCTPFISPLMNRIILFSAFIFCLSTTSVAQKSESLAKEQIKLAMKFQEASWNMGNIKGFMQTYWRSDSLLFIGGKGPTYGWTKTYTNYLKTYPTKEKMGELKFEILQIRILSEQDAMVIGKWHLKRDKDDLKGYYSLLWKEIDNQWKIVVLR